jgi:hypothetical protein
MAGELALNAGSLCLGATKEKRFNMDGQDGRLRFFAVILTP